MTTLSSKAICAIIKECGIAKVSSLKLGDLAIDFNPTGVAVVDYTNYATNYESSLAKPTASENASQRPEPSGANDLFNLALENPEQYEELISQG